MDIVMKLLGVLSLFGGLLLWFEAKETGNPVWVVAAILSAAVWFWMGSVLSILAEIRDRLAPVAPAPAALDESGGSDEAQGPVEDPHPRGGDWPAGDREGVR
jgi:hypothetical protein